MYLAESKGDSNVQFAVKIMTVKDMDPGTKAQLRDELKILCKLDHPYMVQYIESFEDEKYIYIIMEFCRGKELLSRLEEVGKYKEHEAAHMVFRIIEGLNHIHSISVVHRDLKPENIIIDDNGEPKIIDFGLSKDT